MSYFLGYFIYDVSRAIMLLNLNDRSKLPKQKYKNKLLVECTYLPNPLAFNSCGNL